MKNVSSIFKEIIKKNGKQLDCQIIINDILIGKKEINSAVPFFNTELFKSVMCGLEIDSNIRISEGTKFNAKVGVKFGNSSYQYIEFKNFTVYKCERQEDTESYKITAYDKMLDAMTDFIMPADTEKIPVRQYLINIFNWLGWSTAGIPSTFINSTKLIEPGIHSNIGFTFRDVLDELSTVTGSFICVINDVPMLKYITNTNEVINEEYLCQDNVTFGKKYFINSLVFSRAEESDNIFRKDDDSIEQNGLHEFRISDNQILSTLERDTFIDDLFNYFKTLEFYIFDIKSTGIMWFEVADKFTISAHNNTYSVVLLNDEIIIDQDIEEHLYSDEPEETQTEYKYADETDKRLNQTYILLDKQNQKITQLTNKTTEHEEKITKQEQDIDSLKQSAENSVNYKREAEGITEIHLTEAGQLEILKLEIQGAKTYNNYLYPGNDLYPGTWLHPNMQR